MTDAALTPGQLGLWFGEQWEREAHGRSGSALYHINASLRVRGAVDPDVLHRALGAVLDRHPVLRAGVVTADHPLLRDDGSVVPAMPMVDFSRSPHTAAEMARARLAQDVNRRFDLSRGPLLRAALLRIAADDHVLVLVVHHLVCDGVSLRVLYRDLGLLYREFAGEQVELEEPLSWFDRSTAPVPGREESLRHWEELLAGAPAAIELPSDRPRPEVAGTAGDALRRAVPPELWQQLLKACAGWRVTPYMAVLAAYAVLLARLTGQRDLVIGSPAHGRASIADSDTVGMFVTTMPLRLRISAQDTLPDLLDQVRTRVLEMMQFGDVGLEDLVDRLEVERSTAYAPVVQVLCGLDQLDVTTPDFGADTTAERMPTPCTDAKFELSLGFEVTTSGVVADWEYRTELFDESTVAALAEAHLALLTSFLTAGNAVPVLGLAAGGAAGLLSGPNIADGPMPAADVPVPLQIAARAALTPEAVAIRTSSGVEWTYRELDFAARKLATRVRDEGVLPEQTVLLAVPRGLHWAVAVLGTWYAGAAIVPLDLSLPDQRLRTMVDTVGARLGMAETPEAAKAVAERLGVDIAWLDVVGSDTGEPMSGEPATVPASLAYVVFTSGSTGRPKPVAIGHDSVAHHASIFAERFALTADDVFLQFAGLAFDVSLEETLPVWCVGGTALLLEDNTIAPADLERALADGGVTLVDLPCSYWAEWTRDLARRPHELPARLRTVVVGSEAAYVTDLERWSTHTDIPVVNAYGQTETTITSVTHLGTVDDGRRGPVLPLGVPMRGIRAYVLDSELQPVAAGLVGELFLAGWCLGRGYLGLAAATAQRFLPDPFHSEPGTRMYRTGDRVRLAPDGVLCFLGRVDDQVKVRGHRVELSEVEMAVAAHPEVGEVLVKAVRTDGSHEVIAYVVASQQDALDVGELRQFLVERLPSYQVPAHLIELSGIPRTAGGKVLNSALPAPRHATAPTPKAGPGAEPEAALLRIWSEVLGRDEISVEDNFFAIGGDSIASIRMVSLARDAGMPFTARDVFAHQTVGDLVAAVGADWSPHPPAPSAPTMAEPARGYRLPETAHLGIDGTRRTAFLAGLVDAERVERAGPMQRWGLTQLRRRTRPGLYRVYEAFDVSGADIDVDLLVLAWAALVEHHPTLRTSLCSLDGVDLQVVHRGAELRVRREDVSGLGPTEAVRAFERCLDEIRMTPADPTRHCQVGLTVFDRGDGAAYLAWDFSYLALDGWSFPLLLQDLLALYDGFRADERVVLPVRPEPGVIARWWQEHDVGEARSFWADRLAGVPPCLVTAGMGPGGEDGPAYLDQRTWLPADRTALLYRRAAEAGLTLHSLVQGAYAIALGHALDTDDLVFGTVVSGRTDAVTGAEDIVGCLNNRLPSHVVIDRGLSCLDWLRRIQAGHAEAAAFEYVSPLDIQRWCGLGDTDRLYDSEVVVENFPFAESLQTRLESWNPVANGARGDETLRLTVWPDPSLLLKVSYYRGAVSDAHVVELLHVTKLVLDELADGLHRPVADLITTAHGAGHRPRPN